MNAALDTLLIDAGNTCIKFGTADSANTCRSIGAIDTHASSEAMAAYLQEHGVTCARAIGVCVAGDAVKAHLADALSQLNKASSPIPLQWLSGSSVLKGLRNDYATPLTMGADRWLAAYGAVQLRHQAPQPFVLATFGTATTVDVVHWDAAQQVHVFAGGIILAGLITAWRSVAHSTAQLPDVSAFNASNDALLSIPNNTHAALQLGAFYAQTGAVGHIANIVAQRYGTPDIVLAGGGATVMHHYLPAARKLETPVLDGLAYAAFQGLK